MTWRESLEIVIARTGHDRYRAITADDHPDHEAYRRIVIAKAGAMTGGGAYPPLLEQAGNLMGALGRIATAMARGEPVLAPADVVERRRTICGACEHNGERATGGMRCTLCGCGSLKLGLATEQCRDDPPRWGPWIPPAVAEPNG